MSSFSEQLGWKGEIRNYSSKILESLLTRLVIQKPNAIDWRVVGARTIEIVVIFLKRLANWVMLLPTPNLTHCRVQIIIRIGQIKGVPREACVICLSRRHCLIMMLLDKNAGWSLRKDMWPSATVRSELNCDMARIEWVDQCASISYGGFLKRLFRPCDGQCWLRNRLFQGTRIAFVDVVVVRVMNIRVRHLSTVTFCNIVVPILRRWNGRWVVGVETWNGCFLRPRRSRHRSSVAWQCKNQGIIGIIVEQRIVDVLRVWVIKKADVVFQLLHLRFVDFIVTFLN